MEKRRGNRPAIELCNGPAKLCQALAVTRDLNGLELDGEIMWLVDDGYVVKDVTVTTRVGLSAAQEKPWRFLVAGNPYVSRAKPSVAPLAAITVSNS